MAPTVKNTHKITSSQLDLPPRLLLGPGPSNAHPRVLAALGNRQIGHLDPAFITLMNEVQELLRYVWQTDNTLTIPVSGTGSAAMETGFANAIIAGEKVLVGCNGYFGERMCDMAERHGGEVVRMEKEWGGVFTLDEITAAVQEHKPALVCLVHADTSTGARQPMEGVGELCKANDALLLVDSVTSIGGLPVFVDEWGIDICYAGSQKCLSCPPGIAPLTVSARGWEKIKKRRELGKPHTWYLDLNMVGNYWGPNRTYHHTAPVNMNFALREALRLIAEEGLEEVWARHQRNAELMWSSLEGIGLKMLVDKEIRLPSLTTVCIPDGIDGKAVCAHMRDTYNIEIAGSMGQLAGKVWRIGMMGFNSRRENVLTLVSALKETLEHFGFKQ